MLSGADGELRGRWQIGDALELTDLAMQEIAHVEALRETDPAKVLDAAHGAVGM